MRSLRRTAVAVLGQVNDAFGSQTWELVITERCAAVENTLRSLYSHSRIFVLQSFPF